MAGRGAVVIIDPKGERRILARAAAEAERRAKPFALFSPAFPQYSASMNVLGSARTPLEVADLLQVLMPSSKVAIFEEFPLGVLERLAEAQQALGIPWTLEGLRKVSTIRRHQHTLLMQYLTHLGCYAPSTVNDCIKEYKKRDLDDPIADGLIEDAEWPAEHYRKITTALVPTFRGVVGGTIGPLLSPVDPDLTWDRIVQDGMVAYFGLGSLRNPEMSNRLARIIVQGAIIYLGYRYDYEDIATTAPISIVIDEAGDVMYRKITNGINKGGGANGRFILAMQSKADPDEALGPAQTRRVFDNLNTQFCFRLADMETALTMTEGLTCTTKMPETSVGLSHSGVGGLTGNAQHREGRHTSPLIDPSWLLGQPRGHAFCRIAGGWWKLEVPMLEPVPQETLERLGLLTMWQSMDPNFVHEGVLCDDVIPFPASHQLAEHWPLPPSLQLPSPGATLLASKSTSKPSWTCGQGLRRVWRFVSAMGRRRARP